LGGLRDLFGLAKPVYPPLATGLLHAMLLIMIIGLSVAAKVQFFDS